MSAGGPVSTMSAPHSASASIALVGALHQRLGVRRPVLEGVMRDDDPDHAGLAVEGAADALDGAAADPAALPGQRVDGVEARHRHLVVLEARLEVRGRSICDSAGRARQHALEQVARAARRGCRARPAPAPQAGRGRPARRGTASCGRAASGRPKWRSGRPPARSAGRSAGAATRAACGRSAGPRRG